MIEIEYDYKHVPTIRAFSRSNARIRGLMGPFGSGKSSGCVVDLVRMGMLQKPGKDGIRRTRFAVIRNTYPQLRDTTIKTTHQWLPPMYFGEYNKAEHNYLITKFPESEIELCFRALDRPDHVANLLSAEYTGAWFNEAREIPWSIIEAMDGRIDRYPPMSDGGATRPGIILDTNPPDTDSAWYRVFEEEKQEGFEIFKQPGGLSKEAENLPNLAKDYYQNLSRGKGQDFLTVYVNGQYGFVREHKPVYPDYNDGIHCNEAANFTPGLLVHRGWDFGLTPACVFSQVHANGRWVIFDELVSDDMGIERFSEKVLRHCGENFPKGQKFSDTADPSGGSKSPTDEKTCFEIMKIKGIAVEPGEQSLTIRFESVRKPLNTLIQGQPQLQLHPRCKILRKGFMGKYFFRRIHSQVSERYTDEPEKNEFSHPHDGLQYTATKLFGVSLTHKPNKDFMRPLKYDNRGIV